MVAIGAPRGHQDRERPENNTALWPQAGQAVTGAAWPHAVEKDSLFPWTWAHIKERNKGPCPWNRDVHSHEGLALAFLKRPNLTDCGQSFSAVVDGAQSWLVRESQDCRPRHDCCGINRWAWKQRLSLTLGASFPLICWSQRRTAPGSLVPAHTKRNTGAGTKGEPGEHVLHGRHFFSLL